ncbi:PAS domain-containing sensor histidine kinase [Inquilinus sp. KBS0705]|nr:PAS domain-containing sensor histidine kinase [Inquilinus sp. KBS0705]
MHKDGLNQSRLLADSLSLSEQKQAVLAAIIAASDDTIISKTLQGIITSWNPAAERMFGYSESETIGKHISIIIPPERIDEEAYIIGQITQGKRVERFETIRVARDGSLIPISLSVSPIKDSNGNVVGASKIARDIRDRHTAYEKQSILAAIVASSDDPIISKTLQGIITSWNPAAERMFGYTEAEAIGKHISLIIPPDRLGEEEVIISNIAGGNKIDHFETKRRTKNGVDIALSVTVSPVTDWSGNIIGASKIIRDISERLNAQEEKARLYEQVKILNDKKDEFIGLASHELKTPLTSISGYLQILSGIITDEKARSFVDKTRQQVKKLGALVSDLLDISKIEAGKLALSVETFNIRQVLDDAIELLSNGNNKYQIQLNTNITSLKVIGDPNRIEQVIINLLTNAIRYSPGSNNILVYLTAEANEVKIGVQDFGVGIEPSKLGEIFSRFYRVDDANPNISGLGIGLYLSHEIVTRHNGRIWAESQPGVGSTFWFTLPL